MQKQARQRVFVGDLQGCADELEDLLEAFDYRPDEHELWFAGDLVNRGPASARALRRVIELGADSVLGNHDLHLLAAAAGQRKPDPRDTFHDILEAPDRDELLSWLRQRPLVREWDDICLVHAGLHPEWSDVQLKRVVNRYVAPMNDRVPPPHSTGGAVDLFLLDADHNELGMREPYEFWDTKAFAFDAKGLSKQSSERRKVFGDATRPSRHCPG